MKKQKKKIKRNVVGYAIPKTSCEHNETDVRASKTWEIKFYS